MKQLTFITISILLSLVGEAQDATMVKGIAVDCTGVPLPYLAVTIKGIPIGTTTNVCGEFQLKSNEQEFTIVFNNCFPPFEKRINQKETQQESIVFKFKKLTVEKNKECKK